MPLAFILIGEMFTLEQRARMQGFFSGVWGVSSIVGPLLGGFLVDQLSWRWVFYINIVPGLLAAALVGFAWRDQIHGHGRPVVDYAGAGLLTAGVVTLLLGLMEYGTSSSWILIAASIVLFIALLWVESRAADPILPLHLFREKLFAISITHGILTGWAMFGSISFIPLFVQTVLGTSATQAGITIAPMLLGWVGASIIGTRLLLQVGYRRLAILGTALLVTWIVPHVASGRKYQPICTHVLRHSDGHRHGIFDPAIFDRRADNRRTALSRHRHFDDAVQPFDRRDSWRQRDGRGTECASHLKFDRLRPGP